MIQLTATQKSPQMALEREHRALPQAKNLFKKPETFFVHFQKKRMHVCVHVYVCEHAAVHHFSRRVASENQDKFLHNRNAVSSGGRDSENKPS